MNWIETYHRLPTKKESKSKMLALQATSYLGFYASPAVYDLKTKRFTYEANHLDKSNNERNTFLSDVVAFLPLKKYNVDWMSVELLEYNYKNCRNIAGSNTFVKYNIGRQQVYKVLWFSRKLNKWSYPGYDIAYKNADKVKCFFPAPNYNGISYDVLFNRIKNTIHKDLSIVRFSIKQEYLPEYKNGINHRYSIEVLVDKKGKSPKGDFYRNTELITFSGYPVSIRNAYENIYFYFLRQYKRLKEKDPDFFKKNHVSKFKQNFISEVYADINI